MAINFNELTKTTVHIGVGDGKYIEVPMLTVADYAEMQRIQLELAALSDKQELTTMQQIDAVVGARDKLAAIAKKVMPVETHDGIMRMDYVDVSALVAVLCNGKDDAEKDDPLKKTAYPSQQPTQGK
jgi:hypothetical protein